MELLINADFSKQIMVSGLVFLTYLLACLVFPWVPVVRTIISYFHALVTRLVFPGLSLVSVFSSVVFVAVGLFGFLALQGVTDFRPFIFITTTLFVFGLGGVFSINMIAEVIVWRARREGVHPSFGDQETLNHSPMSVTGMSPQEGEDGKMILGPTYKRAPILRALRTGDTETLLPKLRPFVPAGWI